MGSFCTSDCQSLPAHQPCMLQLLLHLRFVYPTRSCPYRAWSGLRVCYKCPTFAGRMSVTRDEVWKWPWPCLSKPWETCTVTAQFDFRGFDQNTEFMDSNFCKPDLSISAGQKYGRIWQYIVVVLSLMF